MNPFQTGYRFWININVLVQNPLLWTLAPDSFYGVVPPPAGAVFVTQDGLAGFVTQDGNNTFVTQDTP